MGNTFSLDPSEFASQAPVYAGAGDQLGTALSNLQSVLSTNAGCWGNDEPGQAFVKTYQPDADTTTNNIQTLAATLKDMGSAVKKTADNVTNQDQTSRADLGNHGPAAPDPNAYYPYGTTPSPTYSPSGNGTPTTNPGTNGNGSNPASPNGNGVSPQSFSGTPSSIGGGTGEPGSYTPNQQGAQPDTTQPSSQEPSATQDDPARAAGPRAATPSTDPATPADDATAVADAAASMAGTVFGSAAQEPDQSSTKPSGGSSTSADADSAQRAMSPGALPRLGEKKDDKKKKPNAKKGSGKPDEVAGPEQTDQPPPVDHSLSAAEIRRGVGRREKSASTPWSSRVTATPAPAPKDPDRG